MNNIDSMFDPNFGGPVTRTVEVIVKIQWHTDGQTQIHSKCQAIDSANDQKTPAPKILSCERTWLVEHVQGVVDEFNQK
jgi:hypothetical protein